MEINKNNPVPLYHQLKEIILRKIEEGIYVPGIALPTEIEFINKYNLSRTTVRQAITILVNEGYLEKKHGVGTFVKEKEKTNFWDFEGLRNFRDELESKGRKISTKCLSLKSVKTNLELKNVFGSEIKEFYKLERIRYVDDIPVIRVTTYVPCRLVPNLEKYNLSEVSLFDTIQKDYGIKIVSAEKTFQISPSSKNDSDFLNIREGSPIQLVTTKTYGEENVIIEYSKSRDRGDMSIYRINIKYVGS